VPALVPSVPFVGFAVTATPAAVALVRRRLVAFAEAQGAGAQRTDDIALASTEGAANVVRHAYPDGGGDISVAADMESGDVEIVIADTGVGFREGSSGGAGLGLRIIADLCTAFEIRERDPGGIELWMRFAAAA
jgi:anti-sigma regulatory factor (Ser/Thr protein kinase)